MALSFDWYVPVRHALETIRTFILLAFGRWPCALGFVLFT